MQGVEPVRAAVRAAIRRGVRYLTLYAFSTENWGRPAEEIDALMELFCRSVASETPELCKQGVRIAMIGDRSRFPAKVQGIPRAGRAGDRRRRAADGSYWRSTTVAQRIGARRAPARRPGRGRGIAGRSDRRTDRRQRALHGPLSRSRSGDPYQRGRCGSATSCCGSPPTPNFISPTCCGPISRRPTSTVRWRSSHDATAVSD